MKKTLKIFLAVLIVVLSLTTILTVTATAEEKQITITYVDSSSVFSTSTTTDKKAYENGVQTVTAGVPFTLPTTANSSYVGKDGYQLVWFTEDGRTYKAGETVTFTENTRLYRNAFKEVYTYSEIVSNISSGTSAVMLMNDINAYQDGIGTGSSSILNLNGFNLSFKKTGTAMGNQRTPTVIIGSGTINYEPLDGKVGQTNCAVFNLKTHGYDGHNTRLFIGRDVIIDAPKTFLTQDDQGGGTSGFPWIKIYGKINVYSISRYTQNSYGKNTNIEFMETCDVTITGPSLYTDYRVPTETAVYNNRAHQIHIYGGTFRLPAEAATELFWSSDKNATSAKNSAGQNVLDSTNADLISVKGGIFILADGSKPAIDSYLDVNYYGSVAPNNGTVDTAKLLAKSADVTAYYYYKNANALSFAFKKNGSVVVSDAYGLGYAGTYYYVPTAAEDGTLGSIALYRDSAMTEPYTAFTFKAFNSGLLVSFPEISQKVKVVQNGTTYTVIPDTSCEHTYSAVETEASCTTVAYTTYTCDKCAHSYVERTGEKLEHIISAGDVITAPTLTSAGYRNVVCSECGYSEKTQYNLDPSNFDVTVKIRNDDGTFETITVKASDVFEFALDGVDEAYTYTLSAIKAFGDYSIRNIYGITIPVGILNVRITTQNSETVTENKTKYYYGVAELIIPDGAVITVGNIGNLTCLETIKVGNANVLFDRNCSYYNPVNEKRYSSVLTTMDLSTSGAYVQFGSSAFNGRGFKYLHLTDGCTYIFGDSCFYNSAIEFIDLGTTSQYTFAANCFYGADMPEIIIPDNATNLTFTGNAFSNCNKVKYLYIGKNFVINATLSDLKAVEKIVIMDGVKFAKNVEGVFSNCGNQLTTTNGANITDGTPLYVYNHSTELMWNGGWTKNMFNNCDGVIIYTVTDGIGTNGEIFKNCTDVTNAEKTEVVYKAWTIYFGIPHSYDNIVEADCDTKGGIDCPCGVYAWNVQDGKWGSSTFVEDAQNPGTGSGTASYRKYESVHKITIDTTPAETVTDKAFTILPALGHDNLLVVTDPSCLVDGEENLVCQREGCGNVEFVRVLDKTGHTMLVTITYANGFDKDGEKVEKCANCKDMDSTVVALPIFTAKGYSVNDDGNSLNGGYTVDLERLKAYTDVMGNINFGIVIANANTFEGNFFVDGKVGNAKALQVGITPDYTNFDCAIYFNSANNASSSLELIITAYVIDANGNVTYIQAENNYAVEAKIGNDIFTKVTLDLVKANLPTSSSYALIPSNDEE